mmetsp:Transcript_15542/g.36612  ORF Transcript_15542/g.36612 Transcript_15542/m.36612 type:complete len:400 (-) Transcript_15542:100-1299(-)
MATGSAPKAPAQIQLEELDEVFGPGYFEHGRLIFTVARDVAGMMKVAHKLQQKTHEKLGSVVEIIMEHVKHELWLKLHESSTSCSLQKGQEVAEYQVTDIPDGIRQHPYRRDRLPTLEVLLLWSDPATRATRGRCLFTMPHPEVPALDEVDSIFDRIEPFFAKRWLRVQLVLEAPARGEFEDSAEQRYEDDHVGGGHTVCVLACHPRGFASEASTDGVVHVSQCQPIPFQVTTDDAGQAKICFLPAALNKVQVAETDLFHGTEVSLLATELQGLDQGLTDLTVKLLPKAQASLTVHVFRCPDELPKASEEMFGIIDWAAEDRHALEDAKVEVMPLETSRAPLELHHAAEDRFEAKGLAEGCVAVKVTCNGYEAEERTVMLLVGPNHFFFPLTASCRFAS